MSKITGLKYQDKIYIKDGRLFKVEDGVMFIGALPTGDMIYRLENGQERITDKDGKILLDFDDKASKYYLTDEHILTLNEDCFKLQTRTGSLVCFVVGVSDFQFQNGCVILKHPYENKNYISVISLTGEILLPIESRLTYFSVSKGGIIALRIENGPIKVMKDGKELELGFNEISRVTFGPNDEMFITGLVKNKIETHVYINNNFVLRGGSNYEIEFGVANSVLVKTGTKQYFLFNKDGDLLEYQKNKGEIILTRNGAVCVNKKGYIRYFYNMENILVDYEAKAYQISISDSKLYAFNGQIPLLKCLLMTEDTDFDTLIVDHNHIIPDIYKKNVFDCEITERFIKISRCWVKRYENYESEIASDYYFATTVLNKDGIVIYNNLTISENNLGLQKHACETPNVEILEYCLRITENGKTIYMDEEGQEYDYELGKGLYGDTYLLQEEGIETLSLPTMPKEVIEAYKRDETEEIEGNLENGEIIWKSSKSLVNK